MAANKQIKLTEPFEQFGKRVEEIELREPTGWEVATIGEPRTLVHNASIGGYFVEQPDVIAKYLEKCVQHQSGRDIVKLVSMTDVMRIKGELFAFFTEAEARIALEKSANFASALSDRQS